MSAASWHDKAAGVTAEARAFIHGEYVDAAAGATFASVDPRRGRTLAQVAAGQPEFRVRFLLGMYQAAEQGFFEGVDPLLGLLLGREPRTVHDVLADVAAVH